jgi:hypothetical protein
VTSASSFGLLSTSVIDDVAPEGRQTVGVTGARVVGVGGAKPVVAGKASTVSFNGPNSSTFFTEQSTLGATPILLGDQSHHFALDLPRKSNVEFNVSWTDGVGGADLDLYVTGAADSGTQGATATTDAADPTHPTEKIVLENVKGHLNVELEPFLITDAVSGSTYTLTATITPAGTGLDTDGDGILDADDECPSEPASTPSGCPDRDGDGVPDGTDVCPDVAGNGADGCPIQATEHIHVYVDDALAASQDVDTANGPDSFAIPVTVADGAHQLRVEWEDKGKVIASRTVSVTRAAAAAPAKQSSAKDAQAAKHAKAAKTAKAQSGPKAGSAQSHAAVKQPAPVAAPSNSVLMMRAAAGL